MGVPGRQKGLRGRFGMSVPPLMEELGLAEVEHNARGAVTGLRPHHEGPGTMATPLAAIRSNALSSI
ncbi:MAG: hypothetical protein EXR94_14070 [Gemmatimonadetes bacterium]|nr:hypothetical protein [Gemmatimonadota bacterium]